MNGNRIRKEIQSIIMNDELCIINGNRIGREIQSKIMNDE
jgi:hypothetical protein